MLAAPERKNMKRNSIKSVLIRICVVLVFYLFVEWLLLGYGKVLLALIFPLLLFWTPYRYFIFNFDRLFRSFVVNSINFFRYKEYNYPKGIGTITGYVAHTDKVFGCCKTLSGVYDVYRLYNRYNGKKTYDYRSKNPKWIEWKVRVISNVNIEGIPVVPFKNLTQLVDLSNEDNSEVYTLVLVDECNAVFNSRSFKTNFQNEEQIKSMVTGRHNNMQFIFIGQRYKYLDALLRNIMDSVYECVHVPLINTVCYYVYSAYDLETCDNPKLIKRKAFRMLYLHNWVYKLYDTKALVSLISKEKMLSSEQVLNRRFRNDSIYDNRSLTRKGKKLLKG